VAPGKRIAYRANRDGICEGFADPSATQSLESDVALIDHYDLVIRELELAVLRRARGHDRYERRETVPGVGKVLGTSGAKIGDAHLEWAFSEAAVLFPAKQGGARTRCPVKISRSVPSRTPWRHEPEHPAARRPRLDASSRFYPFARGSKGPPGSISSLSGKA